MGMAKVLITIGLDEEGGLTLNAPSLRPEQVVFMIEKVKTDLLIQVKIGQPNLVQTVPSQILPNLRG